MLKNFYTPKGLRAPIAQFMSGSGTNVEKVLEQEVKMGVQCPYETVVIVTDDKRSNASLIGKKYGIPVLEFDIRDFQENKGLGRRLTLRTEEHKQAREEYSQKLLKSLPEIGFGVFGGFEPLTNITKEISCLNVHPGDTTYLKDGKPWLVGLHDVPIQRALDEGLEYVRSSVIQAMPYTGSGEDMDNGPTLGLGPKLLVEDEKDARKILGVLKVVSDWMILPKTVLAAARGELRVDYETNQVKDMVIMNEEIKI